MLISYIGWLGRNNIGDEACFEAVRSFLPKEAKIVTWDAESWPGPLPNLSILGGGTLLNLAHDRRTKALCNFQSRGVPTIMWGTGVLPYEHKSINAQVLALLNKSLFVGVRGPDSKAALKLGGFQKAEIIGDPGFLCPSIAQKESKTIAINIGYARHQMYGREEDVAKEIKILVPLLNSAGYEVVLFPMWPDDVPILELVGYPVRKFNLSTSDLLSFLSSCYCTVGMKLHSSVLSAATFTPFISLAYRDKCLDFARSVGLDRWAIRTDTPRLAYKVMQLIEALPKYRDVIISRLQDYKYTYNKRHQEVSLLVNNLRAT